VRPLLVLAAVLALAALPCRAADAGGAAALHSKFAALKDKLAYNQFRRPLSLESSESAGGAKGDVYALVDHPFAAAGTLAKPNDWCAVLILHLNTKYCRATLDASGAMLHVNIGSKFDQPLSQSTRLDFAYRAAAAGADYLKVELDAANGPFGTRDYRIVLEAAPAEGGRTAVHLSYSYAYGLAGHLGLQAYLATTGRNKVGFTLVSDSGAPRLVDGVRGLVERNAMRYYLAIDAFLGALSEPRAGRTEKSLRTWFASCERYARQLHEMELVDYLSMKRLEVARQEG
jgi:hypothetical protein